MTPFPANAVTQPTAMPPTPTDTTDRPGFTFIEVMFAVIVLGIGVIMIAAMLPVAIRTATETREAATGATAIETGYHLVEAAEVASSPPDSTPPITAAERVLAPVGDTLGQVATWPSLDTFDLGQTPPVIGGVELGPLVRTAGDRVLTAEPQFMWLPFVYKSAANAPASLALLAVRSRNIEGPFPTVRAADPALYDAFFDYASPGGSLRLDNYPLPVLVTTDGGRVIDGGRVDAAESDTITLAERGGSGLPDNDQIAEAMVEGAAVVVVDGLGRLRVYRLGRSTDEGSATTRLWELTPSDGLDPDRVSDNGTPNTGDDFSADAVSGAFGYLIGRALADPRLAWDDDNPHVGPSQVVGHLGGTPLP